ncbi:MAG: right-handed parallel beta-helix repeat-containing protein [Kouleothrix sp.]|jgi:hypothetical protein|nr:right-handed parallel beta-helix repeat-containing protein [Kouleothrix sp.]
MKPVLPRLALVALLAGAGLIPPRAQAAPPPVSSTADSGPGTLRQALLDALPGDQITFSTAAFPPGNPQAILLRSTLQINKANIRIDASNAGVILDGSQAPADTNGLTIAASNTVIQGLRIQNFRYGVDSGNGIYIAPGASSNQIGGSRTIGAGPNGQGNLIVRNGGNGIAISGPGALGNIILGNAIGVDASAAWDRGNARNGIALYAGAAQTTIGSADPNQRNVIAGNQQNGVWIAGDGTTQNNIIGNYIGTDLNGLGKVPNQGAGVALHNGAQANCVGGLAVAAPQPCSPATGNTISGNTGSGIDMLDANTSNNWVLANLIGLSRLGTSANGNALDGVRIVLGASANHIGDGSPAGRNIIGANAYDGVRIGDQLQNRFVADSATQGNYVQGNYIGSDKTGSQALGNGLHGVDIIEGTHGNLVGGDQPGQGNLLSGNRNHGLVMLFGAHHNTAWGNLVGPDSSGTFSLGFQPNGGIDIAEGAHDNMIGGLGAGQGNLISGNHTDGIALFDNSGKGTVGNQVLGNRIGLTLSGDQALPNIGYGILAVSGSSNTLIKGNTIGYNQAYGIWVAPCDQFNRGNVIAMNSVYSNMLGAILTSCPVQPPTLHITAAGASESVGGKTLPNATVDIFSDDNDQSRTYEGTVQADAAGNFTFAPPAGTFTGVNVTATATDSGGNTSALAQHAHLLWTLMLYLSGDNDLSKVMSDLVDRITADGPSRRANVIALIDGRSGARARGALYDLTRGQPTELALPAQIVDSNGELDMGDPLTLETFVGLVRANYPSRYTLLSIIDHGGGWAPSSKDYIPGATPHHRGWLAGSNGLSWDFNPGKGNGDYDYLDSPELHQAFAAISHNGTNKLNIVYYDVCLMGMIEVAYQIKDYAGIFVSSQNIGWAPDGPQNRYVRTIQGILPTTTPHAMATLLVQSYRDSLPVPATGKPFAHPYTIAAVELAKLPAVIAATRQLGIAIAQRVTNATKAAVLKSAYDSTQKIDYDSDFKIEPTDGFVDLADFAAHVAGQFNDPVISQHANDTIAMIKAAVFAKQQQSGNPWKYPDRQWNLDHVNGLSIFLPLGEDLILPVAPVLAQPGPTSNLYLRDTYTNTQLLFVNASDWRALIEKYYRIVPVPTSVITHPVDGLLAADITPPTTIITVTPGLAGLRQNQPVTIAWSSVDRQMNSDGSTTGAGVGGATLWYWPPGGQWGVAGTDKTTSGEFQITLAAPGCHAFAVRAIDNAGNIEPFQSGQNYFFGTLPVGACPAAVYLPLAVSSSRVRNNSQRELTP